MVRIRVHPPRAGSSARRVLALATMNAITFATKRAFHAFLRITRKPLLGCSPGLTAARFDLMYVLWKGEGSKFFWNGTVSQRDLRRALGVSPPVVSRMLRALEQLGWVTRSRGQADRRQRKVTLTEAGLACIRGAYQTLRRAVDKLVDVAICFGRHRDRDRRFVHMATLESYLLTLGKGWGDTAQLYFGWGHPDD